MDKYQITGTQISYRINNEERAELNALASELQEEYTVKFDNAKQLTFAIIDKMKQSDTEAQRPEAEVVEVLPVSLTDLFSQGTTVEEIIESITSQREQLASCSEEIEALKKQVFNLDQDNQRLFEQEILESERNKNALLVPCTADQLEVLKGIAKNRLEKQYSDKLDTPDEIVRKIVFREPYLFNHWGDFYTGL